MIAAAVAATTLTAGEHRDRFQGGDPRVAPAVIAVPALTFSMGSGPNDPAFQATQVRHVVELSAYALGAREVTNAEFCEFLNDAGNESGDGHYFALVDRPRLTTIRHEGSCFVPGEGTEGRPVVAVSWQGARAYCRWLSRKTGKRYDLPTAAQWEAAARAGTTTTFPWGDADDASRQQCGFLASSAPAGSHPPNRWGFYDMTGNVWEWVIDCFESDFYFFSPRRDPLLADDECPFPEIRGGSFRDDGGFCRPGYRANVPGNAPFDNVGFRVMRVVDEGEMLEASEAPEAQTGVSVLQAAMPPSSSAIRVSGIVRSASPGAKIRVRVGSGERVAAMQRHRSATAQIFSQWADENRPYGFELPLTPAEWSEAVVEANGHFTSGWIDPHAPMVVAFDDAGGMAVVDLPDGETGAGTICVGAPRVLGIEVPLPLTDLPLQLAAGISGGTIAPEWREEAGREIGVLDQVDPRLFELVMRRVTIPLAAGNARFAHLPPFASLDLYVAGPTPAVGATRIRSDAKTTIHLSARTFLDPDAVLVDVRGIVVSEGAGAPVNGATVVYGDYPLRRETTTDAEGRFVIPRVTARMPALFVDARRCNLGAAWRTTFVFRFGTDDVAAPLRLALPAR